MYKEFITKLNSDNLSLIGVDNAFSYHNKHENHENPVIESMIIKWSIEFQFYSFGMIGVITTIKDWCFVVATEDLSLSSNPIDDLSGAREVYEQSDRKNLFTIDDENIKIEDVYSILSCEIDFITNTITING